MGRGLAEVEPSMVNLSGPPANFSKCYENSVPNPGVLAIPLQQQYQDRECCRKIKDPNVAACRSRSKDSHAIFRPYELLVYVSHRFARSSQARFGGLTLVSRAPWLLVTGAPGLFSWPNTLWNTAVACRMSPTSRMAKAAASRRHRHRNSRGAAAARPWATHARMDAT